MSGLTADHAGGTPIVETRRLSLRPIVDGDAAFIHGLLNEPSFLRYIGDKGVRTLADARTYMANGPVASYAMHGFGLYLTQRKRGGEPIGICGFVKRDGLDDADVGFAFSPAHWEKGYATEAVSAVLRHGRGSLGLRRVVAITQRDNQGSIRVLEKSGLVFERMVKLSAGSAALALYAVDYPVGAQPRAEAESR